jgi:glycine betaine/proline transport system permease protein
MDSKFLTEFPGLDTSTLKYIRKTLDNAFFEFSRNWGEQIENLLYPLEYILEVSEDFLVDTPWLVILLLLTTFCYLTTSNKRFTFVFSSILFLIGYFGMWEDAMITLSIVIIGVSLCVISGIPIGIAMSSSNRVRSIMLPILDFAQAVPTFVYLIPIIMLLGIGDLPGLIAICVYAVPPIIRFTDLGIREVDTGSIEAAESLGMNKWQVLRKIKIPLAYTSIFAGLNQTIMMALGMVVIASMIGLQGLGSNVLTAINQQRLTIGLLNGMAIVSLAIILDRMTQQWAKKLQAWKYVDK